MSSRKDQAQDSSLDTNADAIIQGQRRSSQNVPSHPKPTAHSNNTVPHTLLPLTLGLLHEHTPNQVSFQEDSGYLLTNQTHQDHQLEASVSAAGVSAPLRSFMIEKTIGATPLERFEAHSTYPYRRYNAYQPITHCNSVLPGPRYGTIAQYISSTIHPEASITRQFGQADVVNCAPHGYCLHSMYGEPSGPGNDLAAVGTQFDAEVHPLYAQTSRE